MSSCGHDDAAWAVLIDDRLGASEEYPITECCTECFVLAFGRQPRGTSPETEPEPPAYEVYACDENTRPVGDALLTTTDLSAALDAAEHHTGAYGAVILDGEGLMHDGTDWVACTSEA